MSPRRILVTGGAGFIGSAFVRFVLSHRPDVEVRVLDAMTYAGDRRRLWEWADDHRLAVAEGDIRDARTVADAIAGCDAVVNFAAESHVDRSIADAAAFTDTNVTGAQVVFAASRAAGVGRVLHISTDEVYGSIPAPDVADEDAPLAPRNPYAASKAGADLIAASYATTYQYPITVSRASNTFGPYQYPEKVIPRFTTEALDGRPVPLYGDGGNRRDWTHVDDNAAAQWLVLTEGEPGAVYNVAAGNEVTNAALTRKVLAACGYQGEAREAMITWVTDRPGHDRRYAVATDRVRALGWIPQRDFDDALAETVAWFRDNDWWWRPLVDRDRLTIPSSGE